MGVLPRAWKRLVIVKEGMEQEANEIFQGSNIKIVNAHPYLGGMIGPKQLKMNMSKKKLSFGLRR